MDEHIATNPRQSNIVFTSRHQLTLGMALVVLFWNIAWLQIRPISDYYFFPLWLGYILVVDSLLVLRTGSSPIQRAGWRVSVFFAISVPLWWVFEGFNEVVKNWHYQTPVRYSGLEYALLASLAFSTVVPAVLTTTELVASFRLDPLRRLPQIEPTTLLLLSIHLSGWLMAVLTLLWPRMFFPFVWLSLVFVLDPVAYWLGCRSLSWYIARRDWSPLTNLAFGTLICGWFWEMWNIYSLPKWIYAIPYLEYVHVFEMPFAGYGGYIPFGYEIYLATLIARRLLPGQCVPNTRVSSRVD